MSKILHFVIALKSYIIFVTIFLVIMHSETIMHRYIQQIIPLISGLQTVCTKIFFLSNWLQIWANVCTVIANFWPFKLVNRMCARWMAWLSVYLPLVFTLLWFMYKDLIATTVMFIWPLKLWTSRRMHINETQRCIDMQCLCVVAD